MSFLIFFVVFSEVVAYIANYLSEVPGQASF